MEEHRVHQVQTAEGIETAIEFSSTEVEYGIAYIVDNGMVEVIPDFIDQIRIMDDRHVKGELNQSEERLGHLFVEATKQLLEIKYGEVNHNTTSGRRRVSVQPNRR